MNNVFGKPEYAEKQKELMQLLQETQKQYKDNDPDEKVNELFKGEDVYKRQVHIAFFAIPAEIHFYFAADGIAFRCNRSQRAVHACQYLAVLDNVYPSLIRLSIP